VATAHVSSDNSTIARGSSQATLGASSKSATTSRQGSSGSKQAQPANNTHARTQASHKHSKARQSSSTWRGAAQCATHGHTKQAASSRCGKSVVAHSPERRRRRHMRGTRHALSVMSPVTSSLVKTGGWCCSAAPCSGSASQGKQRRGQRTWRRSGGGVCSTGRSSAAMGLWPGWSHDRGELGGDGCVVELEGRRAPETSGRIGAVV
jgi:hypothetical protein